MVLVASSTDGIESLIEKPDSVKYVCSLLFGKPSLIASSGARDAMVLYIKPELRLFQQGNQLYPSSSYHNPPNSRYYATLSAQLYSRKQTIFWSLLTPHLKFNITEANHNVKPRLV